MQKENTPSPFKKKLIISEHEKIIISKHTFEFVTKYIQPITPKIHTNSSLKEIAINDEYDAFIVGSDQVWRLHYSPNILNYYFYFIFDKKKIKKIAYAASFGLPDWHYPKRITRKVQKLAQKFDAISVREANAVKLCHEKLKVDATHVLDPTMLLCKQDYIDLVNNEKESVSPGELMVYILDSSLKKIINK